jgi:hypothetical protein
MSTLGPAVHGLSEALEVLDHAVVEVVDVPVDAMESDVQAAGGGGYAHRDVSLRRSAR